MTENLYLQGALGPSPGGVMDSLNAPHLSLEERALLAARASLFLRSQGVSSHSNYSSPPPSMIQPPPPISTSAHSTVGYQFHQHPMRNSSNSVSPHFSLAPSHASYFSSPHGSGKGSSPSPHSIPQLPPPISSLGHHPDIPSALTQLYHFNTSVANRSLHGSGSLSPLSGLSTIHGLVRGGLKPRPVVPQPHPALPLQTLWSQWASLGQANANAVNAAAVLVHRASLQAVTAMTSSSSMPSTLSSITTSSTPISYQGCGGGGGGGGGGLSSTISTLASSNGSGLLPVSISSSNNSVISHNNNNNNDSEYNSSTSVKLPKPMYPPMAASLLRFSPYFHPKGAPPPPAMGGDRPNTPEVAHS